MKKTRKLTSPILIIAFLLAFFAFGFTGPGQAAEDTEFTKAQIAEIYGISLNESGTYTFPDATAGYGSQTAKTINVANTSNAATGALNITLSNSSSFTLSKTSLSSIAAGKTGTFTIVPKTGLAVGTYTAAVSVSNANMSAPQSFDVSFTVINLTINLDQIGKYTFPEASAGYGSQTAKTITVTNTSNAATGALNITLSNSTAFTLSKTSLSSIAAGKTGTFTVAPKTGLAAGTYTATVTVSNSNVLAQSFDVSFTVNPS